MPWTHYKNVLAIALMSSVLLIITPACSNSDFTGSNSSKSKEKNGQGKKDPNSKADDDQAGDDGEDGEDDGDIEKDDVIGDLTDDALDKDGILVEDCKKTVSLPSEPTELKEVFNWQASGPTSDYTQVMATPVVARLRKADSSTTIVVPAFKSCNYTNNGAYLYGINGKTGAQKWVSSIKVMTSASAALGDINGDGIVEVVAYGLDGKTYALDPDGNILWTSAELTTNTSSSQLHEGGPALADLDGDGKPEVITQTKVLRGSDGKTVFSYSAHASSNVIVANTDGGSDLEIVTYFGIIKADGSTLCNFSGGLMHQSAGFLKAGDKTMTVVGRQGKFMVGFNGKTCAQVFKTQFPGNGGGPYNAADYDGDGELEFGSAGTANFATFDTDGSLMWQQQTKDASSSQTGATTFDFNGDRRNEVVYNDEDYLRIYDGETGKILYQTKNSSGTLFEYPIIADADEDGHANIIVHANNCFDYTNKSSVGVRMFSAPKNDWVGTRSIWNQHAYDPLLVNDDGSLTNVNAEKIFKPWLKSKHLAGFRNNIPKPQIKAECKK